MVQQLTIIVIKNDKASRKLAAITGGKCGGRKGHKGYVTDFKNIPEKEWQMAKIYMVVKRMKTVSGGPWYGYWQSTHPEVLTWIVRGTGLKAKIYKRHMQLKLGFFSGDLSEYDLTVEHFLLENGWEPIGRDTFRKAKDE